MVMGFPAPELQRCFTDARGTIGRADFYWPGVRLVGEFDGAVNYSKPEFLRGRTPSQVVIDEKLREDRLRALGLGVVRWTWNDLRARVHCGRSSYRRASSREGLPDRRACGRVHWRTEGGPQRLPHPIGTLAPAKPSAEVGIQCGSRYRVRTQAVPSAGADTARGLDLPLGRAARFAIIPAICDTR